MVLSGNSMIVGSRSPSTYSMDVIRDHAGGETIDIKVLIQSHLVHKSILLRPLSELGRVRIMLAAATQGGSERGATLLYCPILHSNNKYPFISSPPSSSVGDLIEA